MRQNLVGKRFTKLLVVEFSGSVDYSGIKQRSWLCRCDCGKEFFEITANLTLGKKKSCGCLRGENLREMLTTHGETKNRAPSKEYRIWHGIRQRCLDPGCKAFRLYGARGIKICKRWDKFENFLEDLGRAPSNKHSVDRIDNDGNYSKENCRWATKTEQERNKSNSAFVVHHGNRKALIEVSTETGIKYQTIFKRWKRAQELGIAITYELLSRPLKA